MKVGRTAAALAALVMTISLGACGSDDAASDVDPSAFPEGSPMARIAEAGTVKVGVQTTYPLIGQQTLDGYSGFDVEVAKILADRLGIGEDDVEFVPVTTPTRETFLQQDKTDFIIAAYTINEEREKVIDFAGPYYESPSAFLVRKGNPEGIQGLKDLAGKKLCVPAGSSQEATIREEAPDVAKGLVFFDSSAKCRDAVLNGSVDASSTEVAILASFVSEAKEELEVVGTEDPYTTGFYGIGVKQESDPALCEWINEQLTELYDNGEWAKAFDETLGTVLGDAPAPPKVGTCGSTLG